MSMLLFKSVRSVCLWPLDSIFFCRSFGVIISFFFSILFVSCSPSIRMQPVIRVCVRCTETNAIWQPAHTELTNRLCMRWQRLPGVFFFFSAVHSIHSVCVCVWMCDVVCWCQITHTIAQSHSHAYKHKRIASQHIDCHVAEPSWWHRMRMVCDVNGRHTEGIARNQFFAVASIGYTHLDMLFARARAVTTRRPSVSLAPNTYILTFSVHSPHDTLVDCAHECVRLYERVCMCEWRAFSACCVLRSTILRFRCIATTSLLLRLCTMVCARVRLHLCYARPNGNSTSHSRYTNLR